MIPRNSYNGSPPTFGGGGFACRGESSVRWGRTEGEFGDGSSCAAHVPNVRSRADLLGVVSTCESGVGVEEECMGMGDEME